MGWKYLATWPVPSSRLHKAYLLESSCNLIREHKEHCYNLEIHVLNYKAVRAVNPLQGAARWLVPKRIRRSKKLGVGESRIWVDRKA